MLQLISPGAVADYTRCALAVIVYGITGAAVFTGMDLPDKWWLLVSGVTGFYFALEIPPMLRKMRPPSDKD